ncbi:MAG: hypothetical protein J6R99_04545 [Alphaproteobacteria bacterium]|nr:hypothetical protein [Alphaproteobacteria bacterium]
MSKKVKIKNTRKNTKQNKFWKRAWNIITWPFRKIAELFRRFWKWIRGVDLIGLVNTTLLVAIIVLFSMLIIDVVGCNRKQVVVIAEPVPVTQQVTVTDESAPKIPTLPLAKTNTKKMINVVPVKTVEVKIAKKQIAKQGNTLMGDVIIDSRGAGTLLQCGTKVNGNLYLQNMRKYTLPCDIRINGNLFLRDVNMLQFCGDFVVTGNIYVSPRSSFGPIPKTARVGGHVVL